MKLMTKEIENELIKHPIYSQEALGMESEVVVKYFNPFGPGTWLITEGEKQEDGDWMLFGYCHIHEWEWGYVMLSELQRIVLKPFGVKIERDLYIRKGAKVKDLI